MLNVIRLITNLYLLISLITAIVFILVIFKKSLNPTDAGDISETINYVNECLDEIKDKKGEKVYNLINNICQCSINGNPFPLILFFSFCPILNIVSLAAGVSLLFNINFNKDEDNKEEEKEHHNNE